MPVALPPALADVDQLLDAPRVSQGLGVLHVPAGHLVQRAADGCHRLVRQQGGVPPGQSVHQVSHCILPWGGEREGYRWRERGLRGGEMVDGMQIGIEG